MIKTKAAVLEAKDSPLRIKELLLMPPKEREVLIKMEAAGLCRSDLNAINGHTRYNMPLVLGHEGIGTVEETGHGVTTVRKGDRVILSWAAYCGNCFFCSKGITHQCHTIAWPRGKGLLPDWTTRFRDGDKEVYHFNLVSSFSEYTIVYETGCVPIGRDIPAQIASILGCSVVSGMGAVFNTAGFTENGTAVVIGGGAIGMSIIQALRIRNASMIILIEPDETKWNSAKKCGATHTISNKEKMPVEEVKKLTDDFGVDYTFDCVAVQDTVSGSLAMTRRGGTVVVVGSPHPLSKFELPAVDFHLEKRLIGSLYGSSNPQRDIPKILDYYRSGELNLEGMSSGLFPLDEVNTAIKELETKGGKYYITFSSR